MSTNAYLTLVEGRADAQPMRVLVVGKALAAVTRVFGSEDAAIRCVHRNSLLETIAMLEHSNAGVTVDCALIDQRGEGSGSALHVASIAAMDRVASLVILCEAADYETYAAIPGVARVLPAPVDPSEIIKAVTSAGLDKRDTVPADEGGAAGETVETAGHAGPTKGFASSISKLQDADQQIWQRFVPLANFLYKKMAIVVLTALFLTFLTYGAMIVFFMTSSSWTLPFELSKGHQLVEKVERDLSSMRLRRNQVAQDLSRAEGELAAAIRNQRDGELSLLLTKRTVEEEIILQTQLRDEIDKHILRLKQVIGDFNALNGRGGFAKNLKSAFSKRLITKKSLNSGTLAVLETMHRMATVTNELSGKILERNKVTRHLEFLRTLLEEIDQPQVRVVVSAGSDLSYLARDAISAKNAIAAAGREIELAKRAAKKLEDSLEVVSANIESLEATPAARALNAPVSVLFVPYTNTEANIEGEPLYGCAFTIIWCSQVGEVGARVDGETTAVHPLFGKPLRGTFVEAKFDNPISVTEELIHAGNAPLFF